MPSNQDVPPWMGQQQPPPPPPPGGPPGVPPPSGPGYGWSPPPPPPPRGSTGLLTFVGVMNLIFSVLCGCITGFWAQAWGQLEDNPTALVSEIEQHKDEINAQIKESAQQSRSRRRGQPDVQVSTEKEVDFEAIKDGLLAAANSPSTPLVRKATLIAGISQAVLLIGSILLLMHKNAGRVLSMLALMGFIGGTIVAAMKFPGVASSIVGGIKTSASELQDALEVGVWAVSALSLVWPAIALLILLASRSIREACQRTYPMA